MKLYVSLRGENKSFILETNNLIAVFEALSWKTRDGVFSIVLTLSTLSGPGNKIYMSQKPYRRYF